MVLTVYILKIIFSDGVCEVSKDEEILGKPMKPGTLFGELAILYNCTRTASVRGTSVDHSTSFLYYVEGDSILLLSKGVQNLRSTCL